MVRFRVGALLKGELALLVPILTTVEGKDNCLKSESGRAGGAGATSI